MKRLLIIGSGDLGQLIAYHAIQDSHYNVVGFIDDYEKVGVKKMDLPVLGGINNIDSLFKNDKFDYLMLGIGYKHMNARKRIFEEYKQRIPFGKIIHSSAYVDSSSKVGNGTFILPGCTIDKHVFVADNVLLNTAVVVAHDSIINAHCFIAPAVNIAGKVQIKDSCIIGIGSTIIDNINIEEGIQVGGGAVVIDNLITKGLYVGVPAILKKEFKDDNF